MADVLTANITHTYAGREIVKELFFQPEEDNWAISEMYRVINTVDKTNIYLPQSLRKIWRSHTTCGFSATGGVTTINDKTISTNKIKVNLEECSDTWTDTVFSEEMKPGTAVNNLEGTPIMNIMKSLIVKGSKSDLHRIVWFADENDSDNDWKQVDGFITNFLDNSAEIGASCFIDMDSTSFETGDALATDGALGLLRQMWEAQSKSLRHLNGRFYVTYTVLDNLMTTYEDTQSSAGLSKLIDGQGVARLKFRGKDVVAVPEWDVNLADTTNPHTGTGLDIGSNLIVYTLPENLVIGTDINSGFNEFKFRMNDDDDEKTKIIAKMKLGTQVIHHELVCVAY